MAQIMTITRAGQVTLPKAFRDLIGVKPGESVLVDADKNGIRIRRRLSEEEFRAELDKHISPQTRKIIERDKAARRKLTVAEMLEECYDSPAGKAEMEEKYGA